jgi:hypothetical protein
VEISDQKFNDHNSSVWWYNSTIQNGTGKFILKYSRQTRGRTIEKGNQAAESH